jgi:hypothetical protein
MATGHQSFSCEHWADKASLRRGLSEDSQSKPKLAFLNTPFFRVKHDQSFQNTIKN